MTDSQLVERLIATLEVRETKFHGWNEDVFVNWGIEPDGLRMILSHVNNGDRTLETGCGYSTVAFGVLGARHTVVSPFAVEHDRIKAWCAEQGFPMDTVTFVVGKSEDVLPTLGGDELDFVLVDGDHAFPIPFIDWFYASNRLRNGGLMMVDDTQLRTGAILRDFLRMEADRWRVEATIRNSELFKKTSTIVIHETGWISQPFCADDSLDLPPDVFDQPPSVRDRARKAARRLLKR